MANDEVTQQLLKLNSFVLLVSSDHQINNVEIDKINYLCLYILKLFEYCIIVLFLIHFACIYEFFFLPFLWLLVIIEHEYILNLIRIC